VCTEESFLKQIKDGETIIKASATVVHSLFNNNNLDYDFALIRLATPLKTSLNVSIACLPPDVNQVSIFK
jgi:hypothetical protein